MRPRPESKWWGQMGDIAGGDEERLAARAFGLVEICAVPFLLWVGRGMWFNTDDWDFLAARRAGNLGDVFRGHYEHWTTIPILVYRALFATFGIHTYVPYQLLAVVAHLLVCLLLRMVLRRVGVRPWLATAGATVLVLFGAGRENILTAFQVTFVGAVAFGLMHLLLADHDGPIDRRDGWGLLAGLAGLMFSGVAIAMVVVVGIVALFRRGWRVAALHTAPLAAVYVVWSVAAPKSQDRVVTTGTNVGRIASFVWIGFRSAFGQLGFVPFVGAVLVAATIAGGLELWRTDRQRLIVPGAMTAGALVFLVLTAIGRSGRAAGSFASTLGPEHAQQGRYVYIVVALLLPAIVVSIDALRRRSNAIGAFGVAVLVLALPVNFDRFVANANQAHPVLTRIHTTLTVAPYLPVAKTLPRSLKPEPFLAGHVTLGWLLDNVSAITEPKASPAQEAVVARQLELQAARTRPPKP